MDALKERERRGWRQAIMSAVVATEIIPLVLDADGVLRVADTASNARYLAAAFDAATAEEIAQQYPSLNLADIYSVLGCSSPGRRRWRATCDDAETRRNDRTQNEAETSPAPACTRPPPGAISRRRMSACRRPRPDWHVTQSATWKIENRGGVLIQEDRSDK